MTKYLVIVESPAKSKTIKKYLGKDYEIMASYGHMRDLLPKSGAVEVDNDFAMHYQMIEKNAKNFDAIKKAMKKTITKPPRVTPHCIDCMIDCSDMAQYTWHWHQTTDI